MRKLIVTEFVSLDGVMEAPGGEPGYRHTGWVAEVPGDDKFAYKFEELLEAEAQLVGRVTYESFAGAWPQRTGEFADRMNRMPKYVVSATLDQPLAWENSALLRGDPVAAVRELKAGEGGAILLPGSRMLAQALMVAGLVDELRLMVFPVVLGSGRRLFPDDAPDRLPLELDGIRTFENGVTLQTYRTRG
jgi:dihydrofolate reductase